MFFRAELTNYCYRPKLLTNVFKEQTSEQIMDITLADKNLSQ